MSSFLDLVWEEIESFFSGPAQPPQLPAHPAPGAIEFGPEDLDILARTLYGEIRSGTMTAIDAVAWVARNRASWTPAAWWGSTIKQVCLKPSQFSCWNPSGSQSQREALVNLDVANLHYQYMYSCAKQVLSGAVPDPTGGCTIYKVTGTHASWDNAVAGVAPVIVGPHSFWRLAPSSKRADPTPLTGA